MEVPVPRRDRREEYWSWVAVSLFLLLALDLLTTIIAAGIVGSQAEVNPIVQWAWGQGLPALIVVNLVALVLLVILFYGLIRLTGEAPKPYNEMISISFEIWIGLLIGGGLLLFANNLLVIVFRRDLFSLLSGLF